MTFSEFVKSKVNQHWGDYRDYLETQGYSDTKIDDIHNQFLGEYYSDCGKEGIKPNVHERY